jgi:hypothetical protein
MKPLFPLFITLLMVGSMNTSAQTKTMDAALNNKTFSITLIKKSGERKGWQWTTDELSFVSNKLTSKVQKEKEGFPPSGCTIAIDSSVSPKIIKFKTTVKNSGISKITWDGTVKGGQIDGTAKWTNGQGTQVYTFSGTIKE